jgi:ABC-type multidrug transport system permease subunit
MQKPPSQTEMLLSYQSENSGSDFYVIGVLVVFVAFFIYTVIVPKLNKNKEKSKTEEK